MLALFLPVAVAAAFALPDGLAVDDTVQMADGLDFLGATAPEELHWGDTGTVTLYFRASRPLRAGLWNFLHVESRESACRIVEDRAPAAAVDGIIKHEVRIAIPADGPCADGQRLEIYTGLYDRDRGPRVRVLNPPAKDDRIFAGAIELVSGTPQSALVTFRPSELEQEAVESALRPWWGWIWALLGAAALAALLRGALALRRIPAPEPGPPTPFPWLPAGKTPRRLALALLAAVVAVPFLLSIFAAFDFIKDDAYISFRYAHNVVAGEGLVFNSHEPLEGITNFAWTLLMVPFEALGLDLFQVSEVLGIGFGLGLLYLMVRLTAQLSGAERDLAWLWGALWIATSSSAGLWLTSGMEIPIAMFLPLAAAWTLWRSWRLPEPAPGAPERRPAWRHDGFKSGVLMGLGCLTRPEIHLIGILLGLPLVGRVVKARRLDRTTLLWFAGLLAVTVPFHLFRFLYYGSLVPNTFFVKTSDSDLVIEAGFKKLGEMLTFNDTGLLLLLVPFAFVTRRYLAEKLVMLAIALGFMAFIVKVGPDEMHWHRLYLPAWPFLALLAGLGLKEAATLLTAHFRGHRVAYVAAFALGWAAVIATTATNFAFTYREMGGFNGRGDLSGNYHPDLGKFVTRHERPGALVAFQDMGSTPYHAPDINFLDFIGLTDGTVARARYAYGLHAFLATEAQAQKGKFDAEMREYFYKRNPEWAILTTYVSGTATTRVSEAFAKDPGPDALYPYIAQNGYQFGIYNSDFKKRYVHVRTWPRSAGYYLSLFRRADLWEKTPGEVVLDAPPPGLTGVKARFAEGLELLGSSYEPSATQRHEFFVTTWWRVPGPMAPDLFFFTHVESGKSRVPYDAKPGDWMYPAERWQPGQIVEHRVLVQLPPELPSGTYEVRIGAYFRKSGERLAVVEGPHDGENRLVLGPVEVTPLSPPFDQLIKPCRPEEQRHHPERILDHGRAPGA